MLHYQPIVNVTDDLVIAEVKGTLCDVVFDSYIIYDVEDFNPDVDLLQLNWVMQHVVSKTPAELLIRDSREYQF